MRSFFALLTRNPLSIFGTALTTSSALLFLALFGMELVGMEGGPYIGIIAFLILPAIFLVGLVLMPIGVARQRRKERAAQAAGAEPPPPFPILDFNKPRVRRAGLTVAGLTAANLLVLAIGTYKGIEVMESTTFCGQACHTPMEPQAVTHQASPHARIACAECHVGPGAPSFIEAKFAGAGRVVAMTLDNYRRPIPRIVPNLRRGRETCGECHAIPKPVGDRLKVITHFADDEAVSERKTVVNLHVGGPVAGKTSGIHFHADPAVQVRYRTDADRNTVGDVEIRRADGTTTLFRAPEAVAEAQKEFGWRTMDCSDCHNAIGHPFLTASEAIDRALLEGRISRELPYVRREGLAALQGEYASRDAAEAAIAGKLLEFYRTNHADVASEKSEAIRAAAGALANAYAANVFPAMKVSWGTYPSHIGHELYPGCFRCHDDEHAAEDGTSISQDCSLCHAIPAMDEEEPEILATLSE